jgi:hypothetical protein
MSILAVLKAVWAAASKLLGGGANSGTKIDQKIDQKGDHNMASQSIGPQESGPNKGAK